jgi:glycosyltransferase involved in cell wall biosynthesis
MKIIIDSRLLKNGTGGIFAYFSSFLFELIKDHPHHQFIFCGPEALAQFKAENVRFINVKSSFKSKKIERLYLAFIKFPAILSREKGDLLISPYYDFRIPNYFNKKSILTLHDLCYWDLPQKYNLFSKVFHKLLFRLNKKKLFKLVTVSDFSQKRILEKFNMKNVEVIYNSYRPERYPFTTDDKNELSERLGISNAEKKILYTGGADVRKNIAMLFKVSGLLTEKYKNLKIICTGNKKTFEEFSPSKGIILTGFVSKKELSILYSQIADLVINLSEYEGFGRSNLEAMAYGIPLVCSDIEIFHEVGEDYPQYVNNFDPFEICETISEELSKESNKRSPRNNTRFDFETNYKKWKQLIIDFEKENQ